MTVLIGLGMFCFEAIDTQCKHAKEEASRHHIPFVLASLRSFEESLLLTTFRFNVNSFPKLKR
eukprot:1063398-Amphidinium_carterae.1